MNLDLAILFVDDEADVLRAMERSVTRTDWTVLTAPSPEDALRELSRRDIAVVVSDFRMPRIDGVAFLSRVRERWPETERILLTAYADEGALERGINEAGISRFLRKPWKREALVRLLEEAMQHARLRRENAILVERVRNRNEELSYLNRLLQSQVEESDRVIVNFRRRWDVALNAISDPIVILGPDYRIQGANLAAAAQAGVVAEELEGRKCHSAMFQSPEPCTGCPLATGAGRLTIDATTGPRVIDARAYVIPGAERSHLCVYRDITREAAFADEAAQVEKMAAIGRLAGGVAHEINNPLHGILSFVQLAQKPGVSAEKLSRYHDVIYECAIRCRDIVQSLRDFSREAKGGEKRPTALAEIWRKALVLFEANDELDIRSDDQSSGASCLGNPNQLLQVLVNLLQNAVDASPKEGVIAVSLGRAADEVWLSIDDQGSGVPHEMRAKIFEPFFTTKPEGVGTGLGLAISHNIVREHGGSLRVGDSPLGGARFELRLPLVEREAESAA
jgi:two-component system, NtrC family, sensor kinase